MKKITKIGGGQISRYFRLGKILHLATFAVPWILVCALLSTCAAQEKKRVAVLNFDYGTVQSSSSALFGSNVDVGKGISDFLTEKLVHDGRYSVIERSALDKVLGEQNFANSDRADSATAAKIGRVLGVDAVIVGTITKFGRDDEATTVSGAALGGVASRIGFGGVQKRKSKAVVGVTARLVDTRTAEILAAVSGAGESTRSGASLLGAGGSAVGGAYNMTSKNFSESLLGEAVHRAVNSVGEQLDQQAAALPMHKIEITGVVADVSSNTLILNVGSKSGVRVGDTPEVSRPVRTITDPQTGKVIKTIISKVGTATVTEVDELSATATYNGADSAKVGDTVKIVH